MRDPTLRLTGTVEAERTSTSGPRALVSAGVCRDRKGRRGRQTRVQAVAVWFASRSSSGSESSLTLRQHENRITITPRKALRRGFPPG